MLHYDVLLLLYAQKVVKCVLTRADHLYSTLNKWCECVLRLFMTENDEIADLLRNFRI